MESNPGPYTEYGKNACETIPRPYTNLCSYPDCKDPCMVLTHLHTYI